MAPSPLKAFLYKSNTLMAMFQCWGNPSLGARDPGSLAFHNVILDRKPIVLTSMPSYRVSRDLVLVSLYARVLHCLELVTECSSLDDYAKDVTFEQLTQDANNILDRFANPRVAHKLRKARDDAEGEGYVGEVDDEALEEVNYDSETFNLFSLEELGDVDLDF